MAFPSREAQRAYMREYKQRPGMRARLREYQRQYHHRPNVRLRFPGYRRKSVYGLSVAAFDAMVQRQGGKCAICMKQRRLVVDHEHQTGVVRGLLCNSCNSALSLMDDPDLFSAASRYLASTTVEAVA